MANSTCVMLVAFLWGFMLIPMRWLYSWEERTVVHDEARTITTWIFGKQLDSLPEYRRWNVSLPAYPRQISQMRQNENAVSLHCAVLILLVHSLFHSWIQHSVYLGAREQVLGLSGEHTWPLASQSLQYSLWMVVEGETVTDQSSPKCDKS